MINKVILVGNLGKDPEVKHFEGNSAVAKFSIATNENYMDKKTGEWQTQTEWHNVVVWNAAAERAERMLKKGMQVYVEGKLTTRKWQDQNGNDRYTTEVVGRTLRILGKREEGSGSNYMPSANDAPAKAKEPVATNTTNNAPADTATKAETTDAGGDLPF